jgi:hypothetical protein
MHSLCIISAKIAGAPLITKHHRQESLSRAYVHAVSGAAGIVIANLNFDYGVDGTFKTVIKRGAKRYADSGFPLDFQLKCSKNWFDQGDKIAFDLEAKNYNDMVTRSTNAVSLILLLLCLPPHEDKWLTCSDDMLVLRRACYWLALPPGPETTQTTKRVYFPRDNLLTAVALADLMAKERNGTLLQDQAK